MITSAANHNPNNVATRILPAHIEETIEAIARVHAVHHARALPLQRFFHRLTRSASHPLFVCLLILVVLTWILSNLLLSRIGVRPFEEPPFNLLQGLLAGLVNASLILTTQRRDDELASYSEQLMFRLSILSEQKAAKIIDLLEELRRDLPGVVNKADEEADALSRSPQISKRSWRQSKTRMRPAQTMPTSQYILDIRVSFKPSKTSKFIGSKREADGRAAS